jgi:hypothetical protein
MPSDTAIAIGAVAAAGGLALLYRRKHPKVVAMPAKTTATATVAAPAPSTPYTDLVHFNSVAGIHLDIPAKPVTPPGPTPQQVNAAWQAAMTQFWQVNTKENTANHEGGARTVDWTKLSAYQWEMMAYLTTTTDSTATQLQLVQAFATCVQQAWNVAAQDEKNADQKLLLNALKIAGSAIAVAAATVGTVFSAGGGTPALVAAVLALATSVAGAAGTAASVAS